MADASNQLLTNDGAALEFEPLTPEVLSILVEDLPDRALRESLQALSHRLADGETPEEAIKTLGPRVPDALRGFVNAGVRTGSLPELLEHYLRQRAASRQLWRGLWASVAYPLLVVSFMFAIMLFNLLFIVPMFDTVFEDFGIELPAATVSLVKTSREMRKVALSPWLLAVLAVFCLSPLVIRYLFGRAAADGLRRGIPVLGDLWGWTCLGEFARVLSLLARHLVPLPEALRITGSAMHDHKLGQACVELSIAVEEGRPLSECIRSSTQFPASVAPLISWGLEHDSLADSLDIVGDTCEERVRLQGEWLRKTLPPVAFIIVIWGVIYTVLSMFLPLISIITALT